MWSDLATEWNVTLQYNFTVNCDQTCLCYVPIWAVNRRSAVALVYAHCTGLGVDAPMLCGVSPGEEVRLIWPLDLLLGLFLAAYLPYNPASQPASQRTVQPPNHQASQPAIQLASQPAN